MAEISSVVSVVFAGYEAQVSGDVGIRMGPSGHGVLWEEVWS